MILKLKNFETACIGECKKMDNNNRGMKRLKDEEQVRQRPGVIFGTNDENGAFNGVFEVIANSIDEAREGYGKVIKIDVEKDNIITVEDNGRGLPMDWNEAEQMYDWELALCTMYASGKYDDSQYSQSLGLNGLGLTSMQYASSFMDVWSTYGGKTHYMHFEKGKPVGNMKVTKATQANTGTKIRFQPDSEVFPALKSRELAFETFIMALRKQAMLLAGLDIEFKHYSLDKAISLLYKGGSGEFLDSLVDKTMLPSSIEFTDEATGTDDADLYPDPYTVNMKLTMNFTRQNDFAGFVEVYHNASHMFEGGKTVDAFEKGLTAAFTEYAKKCGKLSRTDRFLYKDISPILLCVATTDAPGNRTWFKNQTKGAITNPFIGNAFMQFVFNKVMFWLDGNKQIAGKITDEIVINKQAREESEAVSKSAIKKMTSQVAWNNKPEKFIDCSSKNVFERELFIVEGDSALGSVKLARNPKTQAIIPVRGKIINCLKERITRVLKSDIILDLFRVLGCGMEVKSELIQDLPKFDINKLMWGKVIICTDADVDGFHIRTLLLCMFYVLCPSLIKAGRVYIAESPLYELTWGKGKRVVTRFAYDDAEKEHCIKELVNMGATESQIKIERSKGLGENDPDMMSVSTMHPDTRRLIQVCFPDDDSTIRDYFSALLGDDIETRREMIEAYFEIAESLNIE